MPHAAPLPKHPRVGVGLFLIRDNAALFLRRAGAHGAGSWGLVGGHLEFGESPEECAARECREESGIVVDPAEIVAGTFTNDVFHDEGKHYITIFCSALLPPGQEPVNMEPDKIAEFRWFDLGKDANDLGCLPDNLFLPVTNLLRQKLRPHFTRP